MHQILRALILMSLLGCGTERVSHPDIRGEWMLIQLGKQRVPEQDSFALRITDGSFELRQLSTHEAVWGGVRNYRWDNAKLAIDSTEGFESSNASIVSTSKQRLELAAFFNWERAAFRRITFEDWEKATLKPPKEELGDGELDELEQLEERLQGVWEKADSQHPYFGMGLLVEIGSGKIRGQAFSTFSTVPTDLLGKEEPCRYQLKSRESAELYCPNNKKTYPMGLSFDSDNQLKVKILGFDLDLHRSHEKRFRQLYKKQRLQLRRLNADEAGLQTNPVGSSPKP